MLLGEELGFEVVGREVDDAVVGGAVDVFSPPPRQPLATAIPKINTIITIAIAFLIPIPPTPQKTNAGVDGDI
ncbi:hypothetical protein A3L11_04185 [Thermococcus siculi]|uniref:Uncharacterized protein n=1 Tax=Thermococcus siculi TaxID=72803 RepID=A0A2Z2MJ54_9EURY|nr:hypothetical protein A3L11_04185 [Thermococcus siculi]